MAIDDDVGGALNDVGADGTGAGAASVGTGAGIGAPVGTTAGVTAAPLVAVPAAKSHQ